MDDELFPAFFGNKGITTVRAAQLYGREAAFRGRKPGVADFAQELAFGAIVFVEEGLGGITAGAGAVVRDIGFRAASDRAYYLAITFFKVRDELLISPILAEVGNKGEFINFELLVFWGMGIIKSPLFKWDVSADEVNEPAVLLESISLLKRLENGGLPDRAKNKSPDKITEVRHLQDAADVKLQNCD